MDYFLLFGVLGFGGLIIGFIGYKITTGKIIKDQEREIEILKTDNERLRSAIRGAKYVDNLILSNDTEQRPSVTFKIINPESKKVLEDLFKQW